MEGDTGSERITDTYVDEFSGEVIPCPTCWLIAPVLVAPPNETFPHVRCARGHDNALIPVVHEHLRSLVGRALS